MRSKTLRRRMYRSADTLMTFADGIDKESRAALKAHPI